MLSKLRVIKLKSMTKMKNRAGITNLDIKKTDMITKLVCHLPNVKDISDTAQNVHNWRSYILQMRSAEVNEVQINNKTIQSSLYQTS